MLSVLGVAAALWWSTPAAAQEPEPEPDPCLEADAAPYVFILFDTSGSMNYAPSCPQQDFDLGHCPRVCAGPDCYVLLQGDSPHSKLFQVKQGLYDALSSTEAENVQFGFATFNQDALYARSKHWLYQATANGVTIPGWGPFPAVGSLDVLGRIWGGDEGSGIDEVGSVSTNPADLSDAWELARVRALAKGGETLPTAATFFVRQMPYIYRIRYTPTGSWVLGSPVSLKVRVERCQNSSCSSTLLLGEPTVPYVPLSESLVWDNGASRTEPIGYFSQSGSADASAVNTCSGWEPTSDTTADRFNGYSLHWPTITGDPRGPLFDRGDVLPLDWLADHRQDIQERLARNFTGTPDFRTSPYFRDARFGTESFLRLKDESYRPLIASGSTPHGAALQSFRVWYTDCASGFCIGGGWLGLAQAQDPLFACRKSNVILITDGEESCAAGACATASDLHAYGVRTYVVGYGADSSAVPTLDCISENGGTGAPVYPRTPEELSTVLRQIFDAAREDDVDPMIPD